MTLCDGSTTKVTLHLRGLPGTGESFTEHNGICSDAGVEKVVSVHQNDDSNKRCKRSAHLRRMPLRCPGCGDFPRDLQQHWRRNPTCAPILQSLPLAPVGGQPDLPSFGSGARAMFGHRFARKVMADYNHLRFKRFVETSACGAWHAVALGWIDAIKAEVLSEMAPCASAAIPLVKEVFETAEDALRKLQSTKLRNAIPRGCKPRAAPLCRELSTRLFEWARGRAHATHSRLCPPTCAPLQAYNIFILSTPLIYPTGVQHEGPQGAVHRAHALRGDRA